MGALTSQLGQLGLWGAALGTGTMAGVYFTFSTFVMKSLDRLPESQGISAMQSINRQILSSLFMPLFFGTSALSLGLGLWALMRWGQPGAAAVLMGALVYILGMFVCTAAGNVPLNDMLDGIAPQQADAARHWARYLTQWTRLNHLRTVASALAAGLFTNGIVASS